jgi:DNA polymerase III sliding clamp (beta) subunit (PCNA family)
MTSISRKEAIAALEPLKAAIAARSALQELSHIWFDEKFVYATNGGMGIKVKFASPLKCGVPGTLFLGLLSQTASDTLEFTFDDDVLKFKSGRSSVKLNTLPLDRMVWRYPSKPTGKALATIKVSDVFVKALKRVMALRPSQPKRMENHAVCIYAVDAEMDLYVTDNNSLLVAPVAEALGGSAKKIALPREVADQIASQCKDSPELKMYEDHFVVQASDKVTLYSNVFDTSEMLDLPGVADNFTNDKTAPPFAVPEGFAAALERAVTLAGVEEPLVTLTASGKALKLAAKYKFGKIDEEFTLPKAIPKATITLSARLLLSIKGVDKLAIADKFANMRDADGFMYITAARDSAAAREAEETNQESEDDGD